MFRRHDEKIGRRLSTQRFFELKIYFTATGSNLCMVLRVERGTLEPKAQLWPVCISPRNLCITPKTSTQWKPVPGRTQQGLLQRPNPRQLSWLNLSAGHLVETLGKHGPLCVTRLFLRRWGEGVPKTTEGACWSPRL